jgi:hypothetical protein
MRAFAVSVALLATACTPPQAGRGERPEAPSGENRTWIADVSADEARLVYGTPQTDDVALLLRCATGSNTVAMSFTRISAEVVDVWPFTLIAGRARATYDGTTTPTASGEDAVMVSATTSVASDPLLALSEAPSLTLEESGRSVEMRVDPERRDEINRFFAACRA